MKKRTVVSVLTAGLICSAMFIGGCSSSSERSVADYIGIDAAQEAALSAAGISEADAEFSVSGLDSRDGTFFYEVSFTSGDKSYSYDIDALTGVVIEEAISPIEDGSGLGNTSDDASSETSPEVSAQRADADKKSAAGTMAEAASGEAVSPEASGNGASAQVPSAKDGSNSGAQASSGRPQGGGSNGLISREEAESIALSDAGLEASEAARLRSELDRDDGWMIYEVEFYGPDGLEYDYAINAETGEIVASGFDMDDDHYWLSKLQNDTGAGNGGNGNAYGNGNGGQGAGSTAASISEDDAAAIALERVPGAAANDLRIHLDHDDGRLVYEGEIVYDRMEYEFKIDALSGSILEWESERWDR